MTLSFTEQNGYMVAGIAGGIGFLALCVIIGFMVYRRIKANKTNRKVQRSLFLFSMQNTTQVYPYFYNTFCLKHWLTILRYQISPTTFYVWELSAPFPNDLFEIYNHVRLIQGEGRKWRKYVIKQLSEKHSVWPTTTTLNVLIITLPISLQYLPSNAIVSDNTINRLCNV